MKTIALLKRDFHSQGGLEKVSLKIIEALQARNTNVTLLTTTHLKTPCPALVYTPKSRFNFKRLQEFDVWCQEKSRRFDLVFSMDRSSFQTHHRAGNGVHAAYLALRRKKEGFVKSLSFSFNPLHKTVLKLEKATFEDPSLQKIIVNSHLVKNQILEFYSTPPSQIEVVHNGVEWAEMEADFQTSLSYLKNKPLELLFIGHNFERKGLLSLLQALSQIKNKEFHLSIVGSDKNLSFYQNKAVRLGVPATFWGPQKSSRPFYQRADVLVIPSLYDPFANVTVEALAMGLFVISSKTNGGSEVLTPQTGLIVEDHPDALTSALEKAFNHPKTIESSLQIRNSVRHLDYSYQLEKICSCII